MSTSIFKESRNGKQPITIPSGVNLSFEENGLKVKGPKGELRIAIHNAVTVDEEDGVIKVQGKKGFGKKGAQFQGLTRSLVNNAVVGVSEGYKVSMDLIGVGYRAELSGQVLTMSLGLSHKVIHDLDSSVKCKVETIDVSGIKCPRVHLESYNKEVLGQTAARLKSYRPPEPYKGKGVRYTGEKIRQKAGKAAGKG